MPSLATRITVYDNGGRTFDRYTIVFEGRDWPKERDGSCYALAASQNPFHPQGFGQHCSVTKGAHLGKQILISKLSKAVRQFITQEFFDFEGN